MMYLTLLFSQIVKIETASTQLNDKLVEPLIGRFFYNQDYLIIKSWFFELLPELLLTVFILYCLVTVFNDSQKSIFQYYRWLFFFMFLFVVLFWKVLFFSWSTTNIILGFTWINCLYTNISKLVILGLTLIVLLISKDKIKRADNLATIVEFPLIVGFSVLFMFLLTSSYDFFGVYLAIEGLSLTLYALAAMLHQGIVSTEAAIKYFSLGAISGGVFLFGISIIFGIVGSLDFLEVQLFLANSVAFSNMLEMKIGLTCILFGFFFKVSAFPCHFWVADVYEGIWTPITSFFAIVVKAALMLVFIRILFNVFSNVLFFFQPILVVAALGSMFVGAMGALKQLRIKRFIAYTSINQIGFLFFGLASCNLIGLIATLIYLMLYVSMSLNFFTILLNTEHMVTKRGMLYLSDLYCFSSYNTESSKHLVLTIMSMAGLPPLGGFIGKLFLYFAVMEAKLDTALFISLLISMVSTYYYLSFVRYVWFEKQCVLKLYYYKQSNGFDFLLRILSTGLVIFPLIFPYVFSLGTDIAISCTWPLIG